MPDNTYFQGNPTNLSISRSKLPINFKHTTSFVAGKLVPLWSYSDVLPGDTFKISVSDVIRQLGLLSPVMDDASLDIYAFFTPHKLVLSRKYMSPDVTDGSHSFEAVMDAQDSLLNFPYPTPGAITLPCFGCGARSTTTNVLSDYFGYPKIQGSGGGSMYAVNPFDVLSYYAIWNEYFRSPNTQSPVTYTIATAGANTGWLAAGEPYIMMTGSDAGLGNNPYEVDNMPLAPVSVFHGYFGDVLPWPQRNGTSVSLDIDGMYKLSSGLTYGIETSTGATGNVIFSWAGATAGGPHAYVGSYSGNDFKLQGVSGANVAANSNKDITRTNLYANLSGVDVSINELRILFATQRYYEKLARSGNRLDEVSQGLFGVRGPNVGQNRPEYLGGVRIPLHQSQVVSTNESSSGDNYIGKLGATGHNADSNYLFTKSFTTWGTISIVACVRVNQSFWQGINRRHRRFKALDFYNPTFANIGEQPVYREELYVYGDTQGTVLADIDKGNTNYNRGVFGYQEAWAEYRYFPDLVSGLMKPAESLGYFTYANHFASAPSLKGYLDASHDTAAIDRTLAVGSSTSGLQYFGQFLFSGSLVRPMPLYSIPGLIDHN